MRLLVYDIPGKIFVKATHSPETAKISVVAQHSEQVKAYDCY